MLINLRFLRSLNIREKYYSLSKFYLCNYIAICVKTLKLLVSNIQNLQNAKFYSCQIKLVYSICFSIHIHDFKLNINKFTLWVKESCHPECCRPAFKYPPRELIISLQQLSKPETNSGGLPGYLLPQSRHTGIIHIV